MPAPPIYLDHNATTPIDPRVVEAMVRAWKLCGANPTSQHEPGRKARRMLEEAREGIAAILGAKTSGMDADRVIFTSGGTEANNLAVLGLGGSGAGLQPAIPVARSQEPMASGHKPAKRVVVSAIEHPSVMGAAQELRRRGVEVAFAGADRDGLVSADQFTELLRPTTALVSVMLANNETGVIQPVAEIASLCGERGVLMHTDVVQAVGKIPVNFCQLGIDAMTIAPHKFHGPLGIGAIIVRHGVEIAPLHFGGFQQGAMRPGTENVALA